MTREELIKAILGIRPNILKKEVLDTLSDAELKDIYSNNYYNNNYQIIIKQQKAYVINYAFEDSYSLELLYSLSAEALDALYLKAINMTKSEFDDMLKEGLAEFRDRAEEEGHDEYLSFSLEEQIIASGVIIPKKFLLETFVTESLIFRIHALKEKIKKLEKRIELNEDLIADGYEDPNDLSNENIGLRNRIKVCQNEMMFLINPKDSEDVVRKRHP